MECNNKPPIIELPYSPKVEYLSKDDSCGYFSNDDVSFAYELLIIELTNTSKTKEPLKYHSPSYSLPKDVFSVYSLVYSPLSSDKDKGLQGPTTRASFNAHKKKQHKNIKWTKEEVHVLKKGAQWFGGKY